MILQWYFVQQTHVFDVAWDENLSAIAISTGVKYTIVGGELNSDHSAALNVDQNTAPVYVDGEEKEVLSYNINGNTYFKSVTLPIW